MNDGEKRGHGGRNLIILGIGATVIAVISTAVSLNIYRKTGDIYLDRSRPGFITEGEKHNAEDDQKETFPSDGEVTKSAIDEYLNELKIVTKRINDSSQAFSPDALSDETLGITTSPSED